MIVHIKVEDINDSPPVFESDCLTFYIAENSPIGTTVGEIYARDPDEGPNAVVNYSIKGKKTMNSSFLFILLKLNLRAFAITLKTKGRIFMRFF